MTDVADPAAVAPVKAPRKERQSQSRGGSEERWAASR